MLDVGPNRASSFHVVGGQFDTVFTEGAWQFRVVRPLSKITRGMGTLGRKLIWGRSHKGTMGDRAAAIARYNEHIEEVKAAVPADKLLVYNAKEGWVPLCAFIGVPVPDGPFPNVNDRAEFKKRIVAMKMAAYTVLGIGAAACGGLIYGAMRLFG